MQAPIVYTLVVLVLVVAQILVLAILQKTKGVENLVSPAFVTRLGSFLLALLFSMAIGLNLALSGPNQRGAFVTIGGILFLLMLFYMMVANKTNETRPRLLLFVLAMVVVFAGIFATTGGYSWIAILVLLLVFVAMFFGFRKQADAALGLSRGGGTSAVADDQLHWWVALMVGGTLISLVCGFMQLYEPLWNDAREDEPIAPAGTQVVAIAMLAALVAVVVLMFVWRSKA